MLVIPWVPSFLCLISTHCLNVKLLDELRSDHWMQPPEWSMELTGLDRSQNTIKVWSNLINLINSISGMDSTISPYHCPGECTYLSSVRFSFSLPLIFFDFSWYSLDKQMNQLKLDSICIKVQGSSLLLILYVVCNVTTQLNAWYQIQLSSHRIRHLSIK